MREIHHPSSIANRSFSFALKPDCRAATHFLSQEDNHHQFTSVTCFLNLLLSEMNIFQFTFRWEIVCLSIRCSPILEKSLSYIYLRKIYVIWLKKSYGFLQKWWMLFVSSVQWTYVWQCSEVLSESVKQSPFLYLTPNFGEEKICV